MSFGPWLLFKMHLGTSVEVVNIIGASGTIGALEAKNSRADGNTIYGTDDYLHLVHLTGRTEISYRDFDPICLVAATPSVLAASARTPWRNWQEFVDDARRRPGEISAAATPGTTSEFFLVSLEKRANIKLKIVTYEGSATRWAAILAGKVDLTDSNLTQKDKADDRQLKFLAIAAERRTAEVPDVPTLREVDIDVVKEVKRGLVIPKGAPSWVRARLVEARRKATSEPAFEAALTRLGTRVAFLDDHQYSALMERLDEE